MRRIFAVVALALVVSGCTFFQEFRNPITGVNIYQVKNAYAAALTVADEWRAYCYARPYSVLMADPIAKPLCQNRRGVVRLIQVARPKARNAINAAENFVTNNPTLSATTAVSAAMRAVTDFQTVVPRVN